MRKKDKPVKRSNVDSFSRNVSVKQEPQDFAQHDSPIPLQTHMFTDLWWQNYMEVSTAADLDKKEVSLLRSFKKSKHVKQVLKPTAIQSAHESNVSPSAISSKNQLIEIQVKEEGDERQSENIVQDKILHLQSSRVSDPPLDTKPLGLEHGKQQKRSSLRNIRIKGSSISNSHHVGNFLPVEPLMKCEVVASDNVPENEDVFQHLDSSAVEEHDSSDDNDGNVQFDATTPYVQDLRIYSTPGMNNVSAKRRQDNFIDDEDSDSEDEITHGGPRYNKRIDSLTQSINLSKLKNFRRDLPLDVDTQMNETHLEKIDGRYADDYGPTYECPFCPFYTEYQPLIKRHRVKHIPDGALNCKICHYATKSKNEYRAHLVEHYKEYFISGKPSNVVCTDFDDDDVEDEYNDEEDLEGREFINKEIIGRTSTVSIKTSTKSEQKLYKYNVPLPPMEPVVAGGPIKVPNAGLVAPEAKLHEKILDLRCKYCPFFTNYRSVMKQHRTIHQAEGVMYCPQCDMSTLNKNEYKEHLERHYARDCYSCEHCDYTTINQALYLSHIVKHVQKKYRCSDCEYSTGFKRAFTFHRLRHSDQRLLLRCKLCPFITKYRHNFRQHMASHTGKGLLFCTFCSYCSAWETNFTRHLARHKIEEEVKKLEEQAKLEAIQVTANKAKSEIIVKAKTAKKKSKSASVPLRKRRVNIE